MDPISHGIIGLSAYGLYLAPSISHPACLGTVLGAIAPDLDIITRIKGDYIYLKHHRVETHSISGIVVLSAFITAGLMMIYSGSNFGQVFCWTLLGSVTHILLDLFNSYGVALFYPLSRKKYSLSLLTIYDPLLTLIAGYILFFDPKGYVEYVLIAVVMLSYLLIRVFERKRLKKKIYEYYQSGYCINKINIMPSSFNPLKWDFVVDTNSHYIVGEVSSISKMFHPIKKIKKVKNTKNPIIEKSLRDRLGIFFRSFTPIFHIDIIEEKEKIIVKMTDLRYRIKNEFMHHASFYYNQNEDLVCSIFHPFCIENMVEIFSLKSVDSH